MSTTIPSRVPAPCSCGCAALPAAVRDRARLLAVLAYALSSSWFGVAVSLPIYVWARRRGTSFVAWHALQASSISLWVIVLACVGFATGLDRAWAMPVDLSGASPWLGQAAMLLASPRYLVFGIAAILSGAGITESLCGRRTALPLVHGLATRYADAPRRGQDA